MMSERQFKAEIAVLFVFVFLSLFLIGAIFAWGSKYAPDYVLLSPNVQPAATPASAAELTTRVENLENFQNQNLKNFEWQLDQKLLLLSWVALFISFAAGFMGLKTYNDLDKVIKEKINTSLEKAFYQLDPTYLPIHIYRGRVRRDLKEAETPRTAARDGLPDVIRRLELTGLLNVGKINYLDKATQRGITVIPIDDEADEEEFIKFTQDGKVRLDPEEAGFILYAPFGYAIKKAQTAFENTTIANMPATVASMVLVVGRGLKNREGITRKKEETQ
jgi:hypothetical protein